MRHNLANTIVTLKIHLQVATQYRANMLAWACSSIVQIVIYLAIWQAVADANGGATGGYTAATFAGYFIVVMVVREFTYTWIPWYFPDIVRTGQLSPLLLRPFHPLLEAVGRIFAFRSQSSIVLLPIAAILFWGFGAELDTTLANVASAVVLVPLASVVRLLFDCILSVASFWLTRIDGLRGLYYLTLLLLGGQFAPISLLPDPVEVLAKALPFYWALGFPVEVISGVRSASDAWIGIPVLAVWIAVLWLALRFVWKRGVRQYGAVGA